MRIGFLSFKFIKVSMSTKIHIFRHLQKNSTEFTSSQNVHWFCRRVPYTLLRTPITSSAAPFSTLVFAELSTYICIILLCTFHIHPSILGWRVNSWGPGALSESLLHAVHPEHSVQSMVGDQWPFADWTGPGFHLARAGALSSTENVPVSWVTPHAHQDRVKYVLA